MTVIPCSTQITYDAINLRKIFKACTAMSFAVHEGDWLAGSRALGALLCVAVLVIAVVHIWYGYIDPWRSGGHTVAFAFALPVTVGLLVVLGLGFWLGWIMATTREVSPASMTTPEEEPAEKEDK
jgi:hypothetical protein